MIIPNVNTLIIIIQDAITIDDIIIAGRTTETYAILIVRGTVVP
jgi:hypothetical protein